MRIGKPMRRGRKGARMPDLSDLRAVLKDARCWCVLARVDTHEGQTVHYTIGVGKDGRKEVLVDVVTTPGDIELRARLAGDGGVWRIPAMGTEVYVDIPAGQIDFAPAIVGIKPAAPDGLAVGTAVIALEAGGQLLIHDGTASQALPLATKADLQTLYDAFTGATIVANDGGASLQATTQAALDSAGFPVGTSVLRAK